MKFKTIDITVEDKQDLLNKLKSEKLNKEDFEENNTKELKAEKVEAEIVVRADINDGKRYLKWKCSAKAINQLMVAGEPLYAKEISWKYGRIAWSAWREGMGPLFEIPCPETNRGKAYIIAKFGGKRFYTCQTKGYAKGVHPTNVFFYVTDSEYSDNRGYFEVIIDYFSE